MFDANTGNSNDYSFTWVDWIGSNPIQSKRFHMGGGNHDS